MSRRMRAATAVVVLLLNCCGFALAHATSTSFAGNTTAQVMSTGNWSLVAVATSASTNTQTSFSIPTVLRSTSATTGSYFVIKNFGTATTASLSVSQVTTGASTYTVNLHYCAGGTWNVSTGACTGTITLIVANTNASTNSGTATISLAAGASFQIRCQYVAAGTRTISDTVSVAVSSTNLRTAVVNKG